MALNELYVFAWSIVQFDSSLVKRTMVLPTLHCHNAMKHLLTPEQIMQKKHEIEAEKK